jgi:hypothetical protein
MAKPKSFSYDKLITGKDKKPDQGKTPIRAGSAPGKKNDTKKADSINKQEGGNTPARPVMAKRKMGRPLNETKKVPFTTSVRPAYVKLLKRRAIDKGVRPADLLDEILTEYFK